MNLLRPAKVFEDPDESLIQELSALFRQRGLKILNGAAKLVLTTTSVYCLNRCFHRLKNVDVSDEIIEMSSDKSSKVEYSIQENIQYLHDFVKRISTLKVTQGTRTLQGSVNLTAFSNLEILEIKRIPIHLFVGLKSLRNQLKIIICERCLQTLEDLFAMCGGDRCSPFSWPELLSANLSFNSIESLDSSLKLLSSLVSLNISHNFLENTAGLEYLNKLEYLNLSYNRLQQFPQLSIQAHDRLKVLSLRNNNLESLEGLEKLSNILKIDLAYNCLLDHCSLFPFLRLHQVSYICLDGNPISFHKHHRVLAIAHLHCKARATQCMLNGKTLNRMEIKDAKKHISCHSVKHNCNAWNDDVSSVNTISEQSSTVLSDFHFPDSTHRIDEHTHTDKHQPSFGKPAFCSTKMKQVNEKRKIRKCPLVRDAQISEESSKESSQLPNSPRCIDTSQAGCKLSPIPIEVSGEHLQTKQEIEKCRQRHGKEWLVIGTKMSVLSKSEESRHSESLKEVLETIPSEVCKETLNVQDEFITQVSEANDDVIVLKEDSQESFLLPSPQNATSDLNDLVASDEQLLSLHPNHIPDEFPWEKTPHEPVNSDTADEDACSSPFIMQVERHDGSDLQTILVVICEKDIREKDFVTGHTIERLELRNIRSLDVLPPKVSFLHGAVHEFPRICLTFNYIREERKERIYLLEDEENCKQFLGLLTPVMEAMTLEEMTSGALQCLKCSSHFSKEVAKTVNRKSQRPVDGIIVLSSSAENLKEQLREEIACPNCGSEMLTESDHSALLNISSTLEDESAQMNIIKPTDTEKELLGAPVNQSAPLPFSSSELKKKSVSSALGSSCPANYAVVEMASEESSLILKNDLHHNRSKSYNNPDMIKPFGVLYKNSDISPSSIECCSVLEVEVEVHSSQKPEMNPPFSFSSSLTLTNAQSVVDSSGLRRTESDITILSNPSQSSIMVMPNPTSELTLDAISENSFDCNRHMAKLHSNIVAAVQNPSCMHVEDKKSLIPKQPTKMDCGSSGSLTGSACTAIEKSVYDSHFGETPDSFISALSGGDMLQSSNVKGRDCAKDFAEDCVLIHAKSSVCELSHEPINDATAACSLVKNGSISNFSESDRSVTHKKGTVQSPFHIGKPLLWSCQNGDFKYSFQEFGQVDHRLKLYLDLEVLNTDDELVAVLRCGIVPYIKGEEWPGLLVITHKKIYIMKIIGPEIDQPKLWLQKFAVHPINVLYFLNVRLGCQAFQLEFGPKSSPVCYIFILRDADNCNNFVCFLMEKLKAGLLDLPESQLQFGLDSDETLQTIREHLLKCMPNEANEKMDESPILHYAMGYWNTTGQNVEPVSFVTTSTEILIFTEDFHWPLPHLIIPSNDVLTKAQLTLLATWKIQDLAVIEHSVDHPLNMGLKFFIEETQGETHEIIALETVQSLHSFLQALRHSWEQLFGVDLQIVNFQNSGSIV